LSDILQDAVPKSHVNNVVDVQVTGIDRGVDRLSLVAPPEIQRVRSQIANIEAIGDDQIKITGQSWGRTTVLVWTKSGERKSYLLDVRPK
jgi:hypothetical protein